MYCCTRTRYDNRNKSETTVEAFEPYSSPADNKRKHEIRISLVRSRVVGELKESMIATQPCYTWGCNYGYVTKEQYRCAKCKERRLMYTLHCLVLERNETAKWFCATILLSVLYSLPFNLKKIFGEINRARMSENFSNRVALKKNDRISSVKYFWNIIYRCLFRWTLIFKNQRSIER